MHPFSWSRSFVVALACLLVGVLGVWTTLAQQGGQPVGFTATSITEITKGPVDVTVPPNVPAGESRRYGLLFPFQIAPKKAALSLNLRVEGVAIGDFEDGADVVLFDDLSKISADGVMPLTRNERLTDPKTGEKRYVVKFPVIGGFVPLGAKRPDGTPHPHAGTGFGICEALDFPMTEAGYFTWNDKWQQNLEVRQFGYDGKKLRILRGELKTEEQPLKAPGSDWALTVPGLTWAIPDGDDLLYALTSGKDGVFTSGVSRWRRRFGLWRPVAFVPITPAGESWYEATLIRDTDGSLLFSARIDAPRIRVWRSRDAAATWENVIDVQADRHGPVTLNKTAGGSPYIAANQGGRGREVVCLWPLNPGRTGLLEPVVARDARAEFGPPPSGSQWKVDHPNAMPLQLGDGRWHNVLVYRIMDAGEHEGAEPPAQTGCYVEEVLSAGPAIPMWKFD